LAEVVAIEAWIGWRRARHAVATAGGATAERDGLLAILADWWTRENFPPIGELAPQQARDVLARITEIEWDSRPFAALPD
jgi:hypothetical protein